MMGSLMGPVMARVRHGIRPLQSLHLHQYTPAIRSACKYSTEAKYSIVQPGKISPIREVPPSIQRPLYASKPLFSFKNPLAKPKNIEIKNEKQIQGMQDAGKLAAEILSKAQELVKPGITTDEIDKLVHDECVRHNAYPSALLYMDYPKSVCTSVNNVCCHGIPDDRPLEEGDIINIDVTVYHNGFHGDTSVTVGVGNIDEDAGNLVRVTKECCELAISICRPGAKFNLIGHSIQTHANECGFEVVPHFCGHGIGEHFHGPPDILHFVNDEPGVMEAGMTFTIEPILSEGGWEMKILDDGWTAVSYDNSRSAQFEHTILITEGGHDILTKL